jgi:hypothetical protein
MGYEQNDNDAISLVHFATQHYTSLKQTIITRDSAVLPCP